MTDPERPVPSVPPAAPVPPPYAGASQPPFNTPAPGPYYGQVTPPPMSPPPSGRGGRNVLGTISLIAAIVGTVLAVIPGVFVIGWFLLPIAFVLAIISLFQRGRKGAGIAGLVISVLGTIIGVVVAIVTFAYVLSTAYEGASETPVVPVSAMTQEMPAPAM